MKILENFIGQDGAWAIAPLSVAAEISRTNPRLGICNLEDAPPERITYMLSKRSQEQEMEIGKLVEVLEEYIKGAEGFRLFEK